MGSAATFEGAISDVLEVPSLDEVGVSEDVEVDQLTDGMPEAEATDTTIETEDPYAGLSPSEIRQKIAEEVAAEKEREFESRKTQALRDQKIALETEQRQQARLQAEVQERQRAQFAASAQGREQAKAALLQVMKQGMETGDGVDPRHVDGIADWLYTGARERHFVTDVATPVTNVLRAFPEGIDIYPEFRQDWDTGQRTRNPELLMRAMAASVSRFAFERGIAAAKAEMATAAEAEAKAAEEAKKLQSESKRRTSGVQPTSTRGGPASDYDRILETAKPGDPAWEKAYVAKFGFASP